MELARGDIWWADLPEPVGSEPGYRRPVLIVQSDTFNRSRLHTFIAVVLIAVGFIKGFKVDLSQARGE